MEIIARSIEAGESIADAVKFGIVHYCALYPEATDAEVAKIEKVISDAHAEILGPNTGAPRLLSEAASDEPTVSKAAKPEALYDNAHNAAIDVAIISIEAGRTAAEAVSIAMALFRNMHKKHTPEQLAETETALRDALEMPKEGPPAPPNDGLAQQGETEIDFGTFHGLARAYRESTGKEFTPNQAGTAKQIAGKVKDAAEATESARGKLIKATGIDRDKSVEAFKMAIKTVLARAAGTGWSPEQVKALWNVGLKNYLDKGRGFDDMRNGLASDLGLEQIEVYEGLAVPHGMRKITDEMSAKLEMQRRITNLAKDWSAAAMYPAYQKLDRFECATPFVLAASLLMYAFYSFFYIYHGTHLLNGDWVPYEPFPEVFNQALRLVAFLTAAFGAFQLRRQMGWLWTMAIIALFFNPILPVHLDTRVMHVAYLIAGIVLLLSVTTVWKSSISGVLESDPNGARLGRLLSENGKLREWEWQHGIGLSCTMFFGALMMAKDSVKPMLYDSADIMDFIMLFLLVSAWFAFAAVHRLHGVKLAQQYGTQNLVLKILLRSSQSALLWGFWLACFGILESGRELSVHAFAGACGGVIPYLTLPFICTLWIPKQFARECAK